MSAKSITVSTITACPETTQITKERLLELEYIEKHFFSIIVDGVEKKLKEELTKK